LGLPGSAKLAPCRYRPLFFTSAEAVNLSRSLQCGQVLNCFPRLILGKAQLLELLQVHPEFRTCPSKVPKPQRHVAGHGTARVQNFRDAVRRHLECAPQFKRPHARLFKLSGKILAGM